MQKTHSLQRQYTLDEVLRESSININRLYTISCKLNNLELCSEPRSYRKEEKDSLRINGNLHYDNNINALWMFKRIEEKKKWEIVHYSSDLVLTIQDYEAKLECGQQQSNQLFQILSYRNNKIRIKDYTSSFLYLDGILQTNDYNEKDEAQSFILKEFDLFSPLSLKHTIFLLNSERTMSVDLVNAARQNEVQIQLYEVHYRMNQRWIFQCIEGGNEQQLDYIVYIKSALTDFYVVYNKDKDCLNQATYPELWKIQITPYKEKICIFHMKEKRYLNFDQNNCLYLSKNSKQWIVENVEDGLYKNPSKQLII